MEKLVQAGEDRRYNKAELKDSKCLPRDHAADSWFSSRFFMIGLVCHNYGRCDSWLSFFRGR